MLNERKSKRTVPVNSILKKIRIALAALCLAVFFLLFLLPGAPDLFPGLEWLARVQAVPAVLSGSLVIVAVIMLLTLLFGRVYCSVVCPLGLLQDVLALAALAVRFRFRPAASRLRVVVALLFIVAMAAGLPIFFSLVEPYSLFGRIVANIVAAGRAFWGMASGSGAALPWTTGTIPAATALALFAIIAVMAVKYGRLWCNTLCPVGTLLGCLSRFALFRVHIDDSACVGCGRCEKVCKASCLDSKGHQADASRCVACFNCISVCRHQAVTFAPFGKKFRLFYRSAGS